VPSVERPDGAGIHWQERGSGGPLVLVAHQLLWSYAAVYESLIADLSTDHRVVSYDPRGCGASTQGGPYDAETDAGDLLAVAEAAGGGALALAVGYGYNLAARVASSRPDAISHVLCVQPAAAAALPRNELRGSGVLAGSDSVVEMLIRMMRTDPRAALRSVLAAANPDLGERELGAQVARIWEYVTPEATIARTEAWLEDDPSEYARALSDRLWILHGQLEPIYEGAMAARVEELYPEARVVELSGGPISRPDLTAEWVRRATGAAR
jgi:pimeloyl-ACP methyl ester carboxylesterase